MVGLLVKIIFYYYFIYYVNVISHNFAINFSGVIVKCHLRIYLLQHVFHKELHMIKLKKNYIMLEKSHYT